MRLTKRLAAALDPNRGSIATDTKLPERPLSRLADCGLYWMDPASGPGGTVTVAQLTVAAGTEWTAVLSAQGRSAGGRIGEDWDAYNLFFTNGNAEAPPPPPPLVCAPGTCPNEAGSACQDPAWRQYSPDGTECLSCRSPSVVVSQRPSLLRRTTFSLQL